MSELTRRDAVAVEPDDMPPMQPSDRRPPALGPRELARWIWRQLTSMRTALILLFLLAVAAIPGSLIPQRPVDPSAVSSFQARHPQLTPVLEKIEMFNVYRSVWFSAIYLLLMLSLVGCVLPRLRVYAKAVRARPPQAPRNLSQLSAYQTWETTRPPEQVAETAIRLLRRHRHRVQVYRSPTATVVSAGKGYLREAGNLLFHLALLVVLVGVAATGLFGFKGDASVVTGDTFSNTLIQYDDFSPGARFDTSDLAPFSFTVDDFHVTWDRDGAGSGTPLTFDADLSVTGRPGDSPNPYDLRVNHPLVVDGTSVFLIGHGYAPTVTVRDGDGEVAFSGPVIFIPQDSSMVSFGVIKAPDATPKQLAFEGYFFPTASLCDGQPCSSFPDADNPVLSLIAYRGDLGLDTGRSQSVFVLDKTRLLPLTTTGGKPRPLLLRQGQMVGLGRGQGSITFDGYDRWVRLHISRTPGKVIPLVGVLTAIVGLLGSLFVKPRRTWIRLRTAGDVTTVEAAALDKTSGGDPAAHISALSLALSADLSNIPASNNSHGEVR